MLLAVFSIASDNPVWAETKTESEDIRPATNENKKQVNINKDKPSEEIVDSDEDEDMFEVDFEEDGRC